MIKQVIEGAQYYSNAKPGQIQIGSGSAGSDINDHLLPAAGIGVGALAAWQVAKNPTKSFKSLIGPGIQSMLAKGGRSVYNSFGGMLGANGVKDLLSNHSLPLTATGAGVGAAIGASMNPDDKAKGALIGAGVGAGVVQVAKYGRAGRAAWRGAGPVGRAGVLALLATGIIGGSMLLGNTNDNAVEDEAVMTPGGYQGVRKRLDVMSASGDMVFGLHNSR